MPQPCTICTHPERAAIDAAVIGDTPNRRIAAQFSVSEQAIRRHKDSHLPASLAKSETARDAAIADDLLVRIYTLANRMERLLDKAEATGQLRDAAALSREVRSNLELLAKLRGELEQEGSVNIVINPQWVAIRAVLFASLAPFPEARAAVAQALLEVDKS